MLAGRLLRMPLRIFGIFVYDRAVCCLAGLTGIWGLYGLHAGLGLIFGLFLSRLLLFRCFRHE